MPRGNGSAATYVGTLLMSKVNGWLNQGAQFSWFGGSMEPYAPYGIDWVTYTIATSISLTEASAEIDVSAKRAGDRFRQVVLEVDAPVLCTVSAAAIQKNGQTGGTAYKQLLVDDLSEANMYLKQLTFDSATAAGNVAGAVMLLSKAVNNQAGTRATLSSATYTQPTAGVLSAVCDYFPLVDCIAKYENYAIAIILQYAAWNVSTGEIDKVTGRHCVFFHELWQAVGAGMDDKHLHRSNKRSDLVAWSCMQAPTWFMLLPFYYVHSAAQSLPARGLHNHPLSWTFKFNPAGYAISGPGYGSLTSYATAASTASTWEVLTTSNGTLGAALSPLFYGASSVGSFAVPATALAASQFGAKLHVEVIYTTPQERNNIHYSSGEDVIVCHKDLVKKALRNTDLQSASEVTHYTTPKLVVQSFIITCQLGSKVAQNKRMDFSGMKSTFYSQHANSTVQYPLSRIAMSMNDDLKFDYTMEEFKLQSSAYGAKSSHQDGIFLYSLTIGDPYALQKKGGIAFAKVDDTSFTLYPNVAVGADHTSEGGISGETATAEFTTLQVNVFGRGKGMGGKKWS